MLGAGGENMNSDSPSSCLFFNSVALSYSASLWCVLLVGFTKWPLIKTRECCQIRIPFVIGLIIYYLSALIEWSLHLILSSSPTSSLMHWLPASLHSILSSTHLCKFAIWKHCFFVFSLFPLFCPSWKWQSHCRIMHVCMCVSVCTV